MSHSPRSMIVTVYGLYAREAGGALPVAGLVRLLDRLDVDEQSVRAAVSRLKGRGVLTPTKVDGAAGYALTDTALDMLAEGDARIFHHTASSADQGWVMCVFSIPEAQRDRRHVLRGKLSWLGFGQAAPGAWIAPAQLTTSAESMLQRLGLREYVSMFRADHIGDTAEAVASWWNLPELAHMYQQFIADHEPSLRAQQALPAWVRAVNDWRRLPFLDPGLPVELLPSHWPAHQAIALFHELETQLGPYATRQAHELLGR